MNSLSKLLIILALSITAIYAQPQAPITMRLWPTTASGNDTTPNEAIAPNKSNNVIRLTNITRPSFTVYRAEKSDHATPAVLVFPGGGYNILAYNLEGTEVAEWLNKIGITAVVVKYTVPKNRDAAFKDAQRAIRLVRHNSKAWNIDPKRVGALGFSAGGHLTARLSTDFTNNSYTAIDDADQLSCRPDFSILIYPAYLNERKTQNVAKELPITVQTPPTFMVQTEDDKNYVPGTKIYHQALKKAGVPCEFQLFKKGGHGYGLRPSKHPVAKWPELCETWLKTQGGTVPK